MQQNAAKTIHRHTSGIVSNVMSLNVHEEPRVPFCVQRSGHSQTCCRRVCLRHGVLRHVRRPGQSVLVTSANVAISSSTCFHEERQRLRDANHIGTQYQPAFAEPVNTTDLVTVCRCK